MISKLKLYYISFSLYLVLSIGFFLTKADDSTINVVITLFNAVNAILLSLYILSKERGLFVKVFLISSFLSIIIVPSFFGGSDYNYMLDKIIGFSIIPFFASLFLLYLVKENGTVGLIYFIRASFVVLILTVAYKLNFGFFHRPVRYFLNGSIVFAWLMGLSFCLCLIVSKINTNLYYKEKLGKYTFIFLIAVFWGFSKGPILAALFVYLIANLSGRVKFKEFLIMFFVVFFLGYLLFLFKEEPVISRMLNVFMNSGGVLETSSVNARYMMFSDTISLILKNPLLGVGLGEWGEYVSFGGAKYPHNFILEILSELGLIIGVLYFSFVLFFFIASDNRVKILVIFFVIVMSFSGDITYLRFLNFSLIFSYLFFSVLRFYKSEV